MLSICAESKNMEAAHRVANRAVDNIESLSDESARLRLLKMVFLLLLLPLFFD